MATGVKANSKTNASGEYRFNNILVGRYKLTAAATGFTATTLASVLVELNKTSTANLTLQVGAVSTTVEVSEAAATIDTTTRKSSPLRFLGWRRNCPCRASMFRAAKSGA